MMIRALFVPISSLFYSLSGCFSILWRLSMMFRPSTMILVVLVIRVLKLLLVCLAEGREGERERERERESKK